jgi:hypothetical protein
MPKCRVVKGGWSWLGVTRRVGDILDAPSTEWVANRMADGGLVELIPDEGIPDAPAPAAIETAALQPVEVAAIPLKKSKRK